MTLQKLRWRLYSARYYAAHRAARLAARQAERALMAAHGWAYVAGYYVPARKAAR